TRRVPSLAAKVVIIFHVIAYGLSKFVFSDQITIHFLHQYGILFVVEVTMMLVIGFWRPTKKDWAYQSKSLVDMSPWRFALPTSFTLLSSVVFLYLLFSRIGLVGGLSDSFWPLVLVLAMANLALWTYWVLVRNSSKTVT
ncbi:MAG: solute:sodium symporter family transporter, partial [Pseudomonadota bacterium]